jgi:ketosteroid isomerase-like protein
MSKENVEVVQAAVNTWNAGATEAFRELLDPEVTLRNSEAWPEPGPFVGREAVMRNFAEARDLWDADTMMWSATSSTPLTES